MGYPETAAICGLQGCERPGERALCESALIRYYNELFCLPEDYGAKTLWRRHEGGPIRHPAAPGRSGWHRRFLAQYVEPDEVERLMRVRQLLDTETDALLILPRHIVMVEIKAKAALQKAGHVWNGGEGLRLQEDGVRGHPREDAPALFTLQTAKTRRVETYTRTQSCPPCRACAGGASPSRPACRWRRRSGPRP